MWGMVLVTIPLPGLEIGKSGTTGSNAITLTLYLYLAVGDYILGYRLDDTPKWSSWVVPKKWIDEWRYLVYADPGLIKSNRLGLIRVIGVPALIAILVLAIISGKL